MKKAAAAEAPRSFEGALGELESRVAKLEAGELNLDVALQLFEEGVALVRECHEKLDAAEARIVALTARDDEIVETPVSPDSTTR